MCFSCKSISTDRYTNERVYYIEQWNWETEVADRKFTITSVFLANEHLLYFILLDIT
jgi:hypothetical protein